MGTRSTSSKPVSPSADRLRQARIQVWASRVDEPAGIRELAEVLDADERARAERLRFQRDRSRFVARRAFLRRVLAGYLGVAPAAIRYRSTPLGRPQLDPAHSVTFSTSHDHGLALVAVTWGRPVGVDLELLRPIPDALELARRFFSAREHEHLASLPDAVRSASFLGLWTRKESYVKAIGAGMTMPFSSFDVIDERLRPASRLCPPGGDESFTLAGLDGFAGYVGSVACSGADVAVEHMSPLAIAS